MSAMVIIGFLLFWSGIGLSAVAARVAIATPTREEALVWYGAGAVGACILLYIATACGYSPPGSSSILAYVILICVIGLGVEIWHKPGERKATDEDSHQG